MKRDLPSTTAACSPAPAVGQPTPYTAPLLVSEAEAARLLCASVRTLQRLRVEGTGPRFVRLTAHHRIAYAMRDIEEWISRRSAANTAQKPAGAR